MKNCKGVTLVQLIVTVIIIVILSVLAFVNSKDVATESNIIKVYSEITSVKEGVENTLVLVQLNSDEYKFNDLFDEVGGYRGYFEAKLGGISLPNEAYIITAGNSELGLEDNTINYELDNMSREYIVVLDSEKSFVDEVYLVNGIVGNDKNKVYTYTDIKNLYDANK